MGSRNENSRRLRDMDRNPLYRLILVHATFQFPHAIDINRLQISLSRVINREGWRSYGSRVRINKTHLEQYVPHHFDQSIPALQSTTVRHELSAQDHEIYYKLPRKNYRTPELVSGFDECDSHLLPVGCPRSLTRYLGTGRPLLGIHSVIFNDTTFLTFYWPHFLMDFAALSELLKELQAFLSGNTILATQAIGIELDPLSNLGESMGELHKEAHNAMTLTTFLLSRCFRAGLGSIRGSRFRRICIPKSFIQDLRNTTIKEMESWQSEDKVEFLSDNDFICAWWSKIVTKLRDLKSENDVSINNIHCFKRSFQGDMFPNKIYIGNALTLIPTLVPCQTLVSNSVGYIAAKVRRSVSAMKSKKQVEAFVKLQRERPAFLWPVFGGKNSDILVFTNWTSASLLDLNLGALQDLDCITDSCANPVEEMRIECLFGGVFFEFFPFPGLYLISEDRHNYIIAGYEKQAFWTKVQDELQALEP